jgi:salicylate hydroxylase
VVEQRSGGGESGAGLQLSPNASHILLRWGLGSALSQTAVAPASLAIRRWTEPRAFATMPTAMAADGSPFWVALRADLHAALRSSAAATGLVEVREGVAVESLRETDDGLAVSLSGGDGGMIDAAGLIGADGQRSMVRRLLGDARDLDRPGWEAWRTLIPAESTVDFIRARATNLWLGRDSHAVHYPVAAGRLINLVLIRRSSTAAEGWARQGDPAALTPLVRLAAPVLQDLIGLAPRWDVWTLRDRSPSPRLARGRAALVGDAAHPVLPFLAQGAAMAIEDAAVLAASLPPPEALTPPALEQSLAAYARARAARVDRVYKAARDNAFNYHLPRPLAQLRDWRIRQLGADGMRQRYSWLYDWRAPPETH